MLIEMHISTPLYYSDNDDEATAKLKLKIELTLSVTVMFITLFIHFLILLNIWILLKNSWKHHWMIFSYFVFEKRFSFRSACYLDPPSANVEMGRTCSSCLLAATMVAVGSPEDCFLSRQYQPRGILSSSSIFRRASWVYYNSCNSWNDLLLEQDIRTMSLLLSLWSISGAMFRFRRIWWSWWDRRLLHLSIVSTTYIIMSLSAIVVVRSAIVVVRLSIVPQIEKNLQCRQNEISYYRPALFISYSSDKD